MLQPYLAQALENLKRQPGLKVEMQTGQSSSPHAQVHIGLVSEPEMLSLLERMQIARTENTWNLHGVRAPTEDAWVLATLADPGGSGFPWTVLCAETELGLRLGLEQLRVGTWPGLRLYRGAILVGQADLTDAGVPRRETVRDLRHWSWDSDLRKGKVLKRVDNMAVHSMGGCDPAHAQAYARALMSTWAELEKWAGALAPEKPKVYVQSRGHSWGQGSRANGLARVDPTTDTVLALMLPNGLGDGGAEAGRVYLEENLGKPALDWLGAACGLQASGTYWSHPLEDWWRVLARLDSVPLPSKWISDEAMSGQSPHLILPLRALLVQLVLEQNPERLPWLWEHGTEAQHWQPWLNEVGTRLGRLAVEPIGPSLSGQPKPLRGIGVVLSGGLDPDGPQLASEVHISAQTRFAAAGIASLGYSMHLSPSERGVSGNGPLVRVMPWKEEHVLADVRGEALLAHALMGARGMGLATSLTLDVWVRPSGIPVQNLYLPSAEYTQEFFDLFSPSALHGALFARLCGVSLLSLGNRFSEITRTSPQVAAADKNESSDSQEVPEVPASLHAIYDQRMRSWSRVIASSKAAFGGPVLMGTNHQGVPLASRVWPLLDGTIFEITESPRTLATTGNWSAAGARRRWGLVMSRAREMALPGPVYLMPISLGLAEDSPGAMGTAGPANFSNRMPEVWRSLGAAWLENPEARPEAMLVGTLDLAGQALPFGVWSGKLGPESLEALLQASRP